MTKYQLKFSGEKVAIDIYPSEVLFVGFFFLNIHWSLPVFQEAEIPIEKAESGNSLTICASALFCFHLL